MTADVDIAAEAKARAAARWAWQDRLALDRRISHLGVRVALVIARAVDRDTGEARISRQTIAEHLGCTTRSVEKAVASLGDYITAERRKIGFDGSRGRDVHGGRGGANTYRLILADRANPASLESIDTANGASLNGAPRANGHSLHNAGLSEIGDADRANQASLPPLKKSLPSLRSGVSAPSAPRPRKIPIPQDFEPNIDRAVGYGLSADQATTNAAQFVAHHKANGTLKADWEAEWDAWCIREVKSLRGKEKPRDQILRSPAKIATETDDSVEALGPAGEHLRRRLGDDVFSSWFRSASITAVNGTSVTIGLPTRFLRDRVAAQFAEDALAAWRVDRPEIERVDFVVARPASAGGAA